MAITQELLEEAKGCDFYVDEARDDAAEFSQKLAREHGLYVDPEAILEVTLPFLVYSNGDNDHLERAGFALVEAVLKHGRKIV